MKRAAIAAAVLLAGLGGLCTAWYTSSQRALAAELREREHRALRASADRERTIAESLAERLEQLRVAESQRPYFHYQNLYHDPKGISEGLSVVPSPLATGSGNPLITAHFQLDPAGRVTLPTLNEELHELNAPNAAEQVAIRDTLRASANDLRAAAAPLVVALTSDDTLTRETAARIADLEARLAASQAEAARRIVRPAPAPAKVAVKKEEPPPAKAAPVQKVQILQPSEFMQNSRSNAVYRELKQRGVTTPEPQTTSNEPPTPNLQPPTPNPQPPTTNPQSPTTNLQQQSPDPEPQAATPEPPAPVVAQPARRQSRARPVEIRTTDLQWHTIAIAGKPRLVALRGVRTPEGSLVQGVLTPLADGAALEGATVRRAHSGGTSVEGTGWRVQLDPAALLATIRREQIGDAQRFQRTFAGVTALLLFVVAGIVWMVTRAEALALEKSRFAATAAHELRTPLASLRLYSEMIAEERDPERRERYAREISGQTERLGRLVANVLEVTRIERGTFALQPREGAIGPAVQACVEKLRPQMEAAGCPVELRVASDLPAVAFDADALHHIVDNLLDNAEKYSRDAPERNVSVAVAPESGGVTITVSDHGPGVPAEVFRDPRPFRRFTSSMSSATEGLGLGLFLVDRIVRGHGGAIRSTARPGGGASVHVFLPAFYKA